MKLKVFVIAVFTIGFDPTKKPAHASFAIPQNPFTVWFVKGVLASTGASIIVGIIVVAVVVRSSAFTELKLRPKINDDNIN